MKRVIEQELDRCDIPELIDKLEAEARLIHQEEIESCARIARFGVELLKAEFAETLASRRLSVLTHCNTGVLATGGIGTALGVIKAAFQEGLIEKVYASETRPLLQGLRLTGYELEKAQIPFEVVADSASGLMMQKSLVDFVIVGADRIAANGDAANKIGTFTHAVCAQFHHRRFYIAAPISTIDLCAPTGLEIPIERRANAEFTKIYGRSVAKENLPVLNFAFDVTPESLISAIITDRGVLKPNYLESISALAPRGEAVSEA
jgi:methylthioribose-1-phosphate isomerase